MLPGVKIKKVDGQTGVVKASEEGICAVIAPASAGTVNQPTPMNNAGAPAATFTSGILASALVYLMQVAGNPVVAVRANATTTGTYSAFSVGGVTGTSVPSAHAATHPLDDFKAVTFVVVAGGTIGVAGITFQWSLDGENFSPVTALGTANTFAIPGTGVQVDFAVGTLIAGDTFSFSTTGPRMTQTDLDNAIAALVAYGGAWEAVLVLGLDVTAAEVGDLDTNLSNLEAKGKFRFFGANARRMNAGETEAAYLAAMTTAYASAASIRGFVGADVGDMADPIWGCTVAREAALFTMARLMASGIEVDAARVSDGPLPNCFILDARDNPIHHNEDSSPGLDDQRLVTLRTLPGENGTFVTNPNTIAAAGSDYVYVQHIRVMNRACTIAFQELQRLLSSGVISDQNEHILEDDAQAIEEHCLIPMRAQLKGKCSALDFILHRDDDLSSNAGATIGADIEVDSLKYVKKFNVNTKYVSKLTRTISVGG